MSQLRLELRSPAEQLVDFVDSALAYLASVPPELHSVAYFQLRDRLDCAVAMTAPACKPVSFEPISEVICSRYSGAPFLVDEVEKSSQDEADGYRADLGDD